MKKYIVTLLIISLYSFTSMCMEKPSFDMRKIIKNKIEDQLKACSLNIRKCACGAEFDNNEAIQTHINQSHYDENKQHRYVCPIEACCSTFPSIDKFLLHCPHHTDEIFYRCDMCDKSLSNSTLTRDHLRFHAKYHKEFEYLNQAQVTSLKVKKFEDLTKAQVMSLKEGQVKLDEFYECPLCETQFNRLGTCILNIQRCIAKISHSDNETSLQAETSTSQTESSASNEQSTFTAEQKEQLENFAYWILKAVEYKEELSAHDDKAPKNKKAKTVANNPFHNNEDNLEPRESILPSFAEVFSDIPSLQRQQSEEPKPKKSKHDIQSLLN